MADVVPLEQVEEVLGVPTERLREWMKSNGVPAVEAVERRALRLPLKLSPGYSSKHENLYLPAQEASQEVGIPTNTIYFWVRRGWVRTQEITAPHRKRPLLAVNMGDLMALAEIYRRRGTLKGIITEDGHLTVPRT